jgi:DNA-binding winged helix-turn-helix (wHTH) protein
LLSASRVRIHFASFTLDLDTRQLVDGRGEIHLEPKAFDLLVLLASARPTAVAKAELIRRLWPDTFVTEANLSNLVADIRAALGDSPRSPRFVRTAHAFGYAFCAPATESTSPGEHRRAACWIEWGRRRFPLAMGEHLIGRDFDVSVHIDGATVSRRHARLVVTEDGAVLHDIASKNGTFRGDDRVTAPLVLHDGDDIRVGSVLLTFRARAMATSTETQAPPGKRAR